MCQIEVKGMEGREDSSCRLDKIDDRASLKITWFLIDEGM